MEIEISDESDILEAKRMAQEAAKIVVNVTKKMAKDITAEARKEIVINTTDSATTAAVVAAEIAATNAKIAFEMTALIEALVLANQEYKKAEIETRQLAFYDSLTGLPNRLKLLERMDFLIQLSHREDRKFTVMMLDLDKFKSVNDTLGHAAGDDLLKQVALRISACLRDSDMVARLGGDEFVILLPNGHTPENAEKVAAEIITNLTIPFKLLDGNNTQIGASIGISFYPQHGITSTELMNAADIALYKSKYSGGNCLFLYDIIHATPRHATPRHATETENDKNVAHSLCF